MQKFKKFPKTRAHIFCPYCSSAITKLRFNFDANSFPVGSGEKNFLLHCEKCSRDFVIAGIGVGNTADYSELYLVSSNKGESDGFEKGEKLFCPFDGISRYLKISEAVSVDYDGDVDMENFLECSHCKGKVYLHVFDMQDEHDRQFWEKLKNEKLSTKTFDSDEI